MLRVSLRRDVLRLSSRSLSTANPNLQPEDNTNNHEEPSKPRPTARVATSWGNISIPSREEFLKAERDSNNSVTPPRQAFYEPNLGYLNNSNRKGRGNGGNSFAARLAQSYERQHPTANPPSLEAPSERQQRPHRQPSTPPPDGASPESNQQQQQQQPQSDATRLFLEQHQLRDKVRRESAASNGFPPRQQQQQQRRRPQPQSRSSPSPSSSEVSDDLVAWQPQRDRPRRARESFTSNKNENTERARGSARPTQRPSRSNSGRTNVVVKPSLADDASAAEGDIPFEVIEDGGEGSAPAEFKTPEEVYEDLTVVLGGGGGGSVTNALTAKTRPAVVVTPEVLRWVRETKGGDYSRFDTPSPSVFSTPPSQLAVIPQAERVLAGRRDVGINQRKATLNIVSSAAKVGNVKAVARA